MKDMSILLQGDTVDLRLIQLTDKDLYFRVGFEHMDQDTAYFTGSTGPSSQEITDRYIDRIVNDDSRYDFLIFDKANQLLGEVVINDIEEAGGLSHFRICLFRAQNFNQGVGSEATRLALRFAFESLRLHRVELEVYDYNPRARHVYEKLGFIQEGVKRDAVFIRGKYHDVILMSMLETDYFLVS